MIEREATPCPRVDSAGLRHQRTLRGVLLYHVATDVTFETNDVGLQILQQLDGRHTSRQVAEALAARYGQPLPAVRADVEGFVQALDSHDFVEWV